MEDMPLVGEHREFFRPEPGTPARLHNGERLDDIHLDTVAQRERSLLEVGIAEGHVTVAGGLGNQRLLV